MIDVGHKSSNGIAIAEKGTYNNNKIQTTILVNYWMQCECLHFSTRSTIKI